MSFTKTACASTLAAAEQAFSGKKAVCGTLALNRLSDMVMGVGGAGSSLVKCLLCMHQGLSLVPSTM